MQRSSANCQLSSIDFQIRSEFCLSSGSDMFVGSVDLQQNTIWFTNVPYIETQFIDSIHENLVTFHRAIELHPRNAVYYCNRAAVYSKLGDHRSAIRDCQTALHFDPQYSKAYGRLGLAHSSLEEYGKAKEYYEKAIQLEPANESLKNNLQIVDEKLNQQATTPVGTSHIPSFSANPPHIDFTSMLRNPVLLNMAKQMLSDPSMQNMMSTLMSGALERDDGMDSLLEA
ncbi:hypothetical protein QAD02_021701 [Eretmocerus hayati]|uniref:Uncharacterized protein n=1 Tax=Eretmocerus hayati TaxID=131215 RepID=A0ACC2PS20_9HYME|nr:hypothetical protein QAD02_021701 [Eretmocerus hayati]